MNLTTAVIVRAAEIRGNYLHGLFYYGIEDCCECKSKLKKLAISHFLQTKQICLANTECLNDYPDQDLVQDIFENDGETVVSCSATIIEVTLSCSDPTITVV